MQITLSYPNLTLPTLPYFQILSLTDLSEFYSNIIKFFVGFHAYTACLRRCYAVRGIQNSKFKIA